MSKNNDAVIEFKNGAVLVIKNLIDEKKLRGASCDWLVIYNDIDDEE